MCELILQTNGNYRWNCYDFRIAVFGVCAPRAILFPLALALSPSPLCSALFLFVFHFTCCAINCQWPLFFPHIRLVRDCCLLSAALWNSRHLCFTQHPCALFANHQIICSNKMNHFKWSPQTNRATLSFDSLYKWDQGIISPFIDLCKSVGLFFLLFCNTNGLLFRIYQPRSNGEKQKYGSNIFLKFVFIRCRNGKRHKCSCYALFDWFGW